MTNDDTSVVLGTLPERIGLGACGLGVVVTTGLGACGLGVVVTTGFGAVPVLVDVKHPLMIIALISSSIIVLILIPGFFKLPPF